MNSVSTKFSYKCEKSLEERIQESKEHKEKYPDSILVIVEKHQSSKLAALKQRKFMVNGTFRVYHLNLLIRKKMSLNKAEALYLFVNGKDLLKTDTLLSEVYEKYMDEDGFMYITYNEYNSFG